MQLTTGVPCERATGVPSTVNEAPWASRRVLVQGPAGTGKSLFAWSLYSRFGAMQVNTRWLAG